MKKKFIISWIVLGVILVVSYYLLGGFTEVKLDLIQEPAFEIVGKMYHGTPYDKTMDSLVNAIHTQYEQGIIEGTFSICFFEDPDEVDTLDILIGIIPESPVANLPEGFTKKSFEASSAIKASIEAEAVVAPSATDTNDKIRSFAEKKALTISGVYIEKYVEDFRIVTVVPVTKSGKSAQQQI
ncbi:MAG: hypothetical protein CMO01_04345 [Thalassobius sp.]|nr:hypothetical protein [Thalassovita sp.]